MADGPARDRQTFWTILGSVFGGLSLIVAIVAVVIAHQDSLGQNQSQSQSDVPTTTPVAAPPPNPSPPPDIPTANSPPNSLTGPASKLFTSLHTDVGGIDPESCVPVYISGERPPSEATIECDSLDPTLDFRVRYRMFATSADAAAFMNSFTLRLPSGPCTDSGNSSLSVWNVGSRQVGTLICARTDDGNPALYWGDTANNVVIGQVNASSAADNLAWWEAHAATVPWG